MIREGTSEDVLGNMANIKSLDEFLNTCPLLAEHGITVREGISERTLFIEDSVTVTLTHAGMTSCRLEETNMYITSSADIRYSVL